MIEILQPVSTSIVFLVANLVILRFILWSNRAEDQIMLFRYTLWSKRLQQQAQEDESIEMLSDKANIDPGEILGWEFEYARTTASESMQDRHTMINFYLLVVGVVASGVVTLLSAAPDPSQAAIPRNTIGTVLLWLLCMIGWFYFLSVIRLRQAWHGSAQAMNQIKDFCIRHAKDVDPNILRKAFLWRPNTVPPPAKAWTVFFYAAMLIGFLDSVAYIAGGILILMDFKATPPGTWWPVLLVLLMGLCFFIFHIWLYFAFLSPQLAPAPPAKERAARTQKET
jgi:hypothetical protein